MCDLLLRRFTAEGSKLAKVAMLLTVASCNTTIADAPVALDDACDNELLELVRKALGTPNVAPVKLTFNTDGVRAFLRTSSGADQHLRLGNATNSSFSQPFQVC